MGSAISTPTYQAKVTNLTDVNAQSFTQFLPAGVVVPYAGAAAPSGYLLCDGSAVSRTTYAALFAVLSTAFGSGDGSTTFNLPDMRETIPVGVGTRGAGVTAHDTYTLGQFKDDQMQGHVHDVYVRNQQPPTTPARIQPSNTGGIENTLSGQMSGPVSDGTNGTPRTGTTTHGKQMGLNYIIKY